MPTDTAEVMTTAIKARLVAKGFVFTAPGKAEDLILEIMTELKTQIGKMTVTHTGATTCGAGAGTEVGTGTVA